MRFDSVGFFWEDKPIHRRADRNTERPIPAIPDTGWRPVALLPDLSTAKAIALDVETYDPELKKLGPGWARSSGYLCGLSIAVKDRDGECHQWYFPIRHKVGGELNMPAEQVLEWARQNLCRPNQPKIGANLMYDIGWLRHEGVPVTGPFYDMQFAAALLDERASVDLNSLGERYLGEHKVTAELYQWCQQAYGGSETDQRGNIWRAPPALVGPYAEADASLPLRLAPILYKALESEDLLEVFFLESRLLPLLIEMRQVGVSVDVAKGEEVSAILDQQLVELQQQLDVLGGQEVNVNAADSLAKAFDHCGYGYPVTTKGRPSFTEAFLKEAGHPLAEAVLAVRKHRKINETFIKAYILEANVGGKIHCQFHPLRGDANGTRSGRLSSSTPNLQNIPSRDKLLAPLVRGLFIPDEGHLRWRRYDYSQIEYRCLAHFAVGDKSDDVRSIYNREATTDYHEMTRQFVHQQVGQLLDRKAIKGINFGLIYGMGKDKLTRGLGLNRADGIALFNNYHKGAPYVRATMDEVQREAEITGCVKTLTGRKSRFDLWENRNAGGGSIALPLEEALTQYSALRRAHLHKALNRKLQGSAADIMKVAMVSCYEAGLFDVTGVPRITVHDELDFSEKEGCTEAFAEVQHLMETAWSLRVPVKADCEVGPNWGQLQKL